MQIKPASVMPLLALCCISACAAPGLGANPGDPYEATNRQIHEFNKDLDQALLRPAGQAAAGLPLEIREPIINFSDNVALPGMVLNGLLQGDIDGALTNAFRFAINSTWGILGLADPAAELGLAEQETDFGETLAVWGVPEGAYLELPALGPSTERDAVGRLVDFLIDPLDHFGSRQMLAYATVATAAERVIERGTFGGMLDSILYDSADSYAQTRLIYLQNRRFELGAAAGDADLDLYTNPYIDPYEATE